MAGTCHACCSGIPWINDEQMTQQNMLVVVWARAFYIAYKEDTPVVQIEATHGHGLGRFWIGRDLQRQGEDNY